MYRVVVMLSSFNGIRFLEEQIDSIINQNDIKIVLVIRDDGSSKDTIDTIKSISRKYPQKIDFIQGDNLGFVGSFSELAKYANINYPDADYYAFSDQDDVWYPNKMITACTALAKFSSESPNLFCSNSDLITAKNDVIGRFRNKYPRFTRGNVIYYGTFQGCSMVFNSVALNEYVKHPPISAYHDRWMYLICHFLGNIYYDDNSLFGYRIHESNVVGTKVKEDNFKRDLSKIHRKKNNINKIVIKEFVDSWGISMNPKDMVNINVYYSYSDSYLSKLKLLFKPSFGPREISYRGIIGHFFRVLRNEL